MQKKVIALAIAGLVSGGAFAQSNVTISGSLDGSIYINKATNSTTYGFASNNANSSRFSFKGTEDLGGGLKAFFDLTEEINLLTGGSGSGASGATATGYNNYSRGANIGLIGRMGKLTAGRQAVPTYATVGTGDALGFNSGGILNLWAFGALLNAAPAASRLNNLSTPAVGLSNTSGGALLPNSFAGGLGYDTPNFNGFVLKLFNTFGQGITGASFNDGSQSDITLTFNNGVIGAVAGHNEWKSKVAAAATGSFGPVITVSKFNTLGVNWTSGPMKLAAGYVKTSYDSSLTNPTATTGLHDNSVWSVSGSYTMGAMRYAGGYSKIKDINNTANGAGELTFLADYSLSKRTDVYAILTSVKNKGASFLGGLYGGNALNNVAGSSLNSQGGTSNSLALGMRVGF